MKKLIVTALVLGFGATSPTRADESSLYVYKTVLQVRSGNYAAPIGQNGEERFLAR